MSDINIRIETQEEEIEALIARIDDAIRKRDTLLAGPMLPELREKAVDRPTADVTELDFRISQLEDRLQDAQDWLLQLYDKADIEAMLDPDKVEASLDRWVSQFESAEARAAWVEQRVDQVLMEVGGLDAILLRTEIQAQVVGAEVEATEAELTGLMALLEELNLPGVSRASRMLLLRIPGLREVLRLMYQIKMLRHELLLPGPVGKIVAVLVTLTYLVQAYEKRQKMIEARMKKLEGDMELRMITLEEAVRGYGQIPERYRSTVPP